MSATNEDVKALERGFLFHGTCEPIVGVLHVGGYDKILWTAETSAVAQAYIPESGVETLTALRIGHQEIHRPKKDPFWMGVYRQMGIWWRADTQWDHLDRATSWAWEGNRQVYDDDIAAFFESLGYRGEGSYYVNYRLKTKFHKGDDIILPADYLMPGTLFIINGKSQLKLYDHSGVGDLTEPAYHHLKTFREAEEAGYDGVVIDDYLQSKHWGNFGHRSIGLFRAAFAKITYETVPCVRYDPEDIEGWRTPTPEFQQYARRVLNDL